MKNKKFSTTIYILGALFLLAAEFLFHRRTVFQMDDLWYATNLATGEKLQTPSDVFAGQVWHYMNWGGRSITHALLQFIIMGGELFADILNVLITVLLSFTAALFVNKEYRLKAACFVSVMLISFNPDIQMSMFWQSGSVNYLYSTIWILAFMFVYLRETRENTQPLKGIVFWIVPLGLITGWSNENMGPASFCLALMTIIFLRKKNKKIPFWMFEGACFSLLGSAACILAPGNFVRSEFVEEKNLIMLVRDRVLSMMTGGCSYLLPSLLTLLFVLILSTKYCKQKLNPDEIILMITAFLAYGAMALSPHFPARAAFGIMVLNIVLSQRFMSKISQEKRGFENVVFLVFLVTLADACLTMAIRI